jgi:hypothetical protein
LLGLFGFTETVARIVTARPPATFGTIAYRDPAISFCVHLKFEIFNLKSPVPLQALQNRPNVA